MGALARFRNLEIDWEMGPEDAVALYLEWGNTGYGGGYENRIKGLASDVSNYFVVYTWDEQPKVYLVRRTKEGSEELAELPLPENLGRRFQEEVGRFKGVYRVNPEIRQWLEQELAA